MNPEDPQDAMGGAPVQEVPPGGEASNRELLALMANMMRQQQQLMQQLAQPLQPPTPQGPREVVLANPEVMPKYDGKKNVDDFLETYEAMSMGEPLTNKRLLGHLKGDALEWYMRNATKLVNLDWVGIRAELVRAFRASDPMQEWWNQLQSRVQRKNEGARSYIIDKQYYCLKVNPNMREGEMLLWIRAGLNPDCLRAAGLVNPVTVDQLISVCAGVESVEQVLAQKSQPRQGRNGGNGKQQQAGSANGKGGPTPPKPPSAEQPKSKRPLEEVTCYNCQKKGHYSSQCKEPKAPRVHPAATTSSTSEN